MVYGKIKEKSNFASVRKVFKRVGMGECNAHYTSIFKNFNNGARIRLVVEEISHMEWVSGAYGSGVALLWVG